MLKIISFFEQSEIKFHCEIGVGFKYMYIVELDQYNYVEFIIMDI